MPSNKDTALAAIDAAMQHMNGNRIALAYLQEARDELVQLEELKRKRSAKKSGGEKTSVRDRAILGSPDLAPA